MQIVLERKIKNVTSTEGNLYVNGEWFCHTIEDVVRAKPGEWKESLKVYAQTAIPYGTYPVLSTWSNRFKRMLTGVFNVPDFSGIRIHNGSSENSSAGCIIVSYKNDAKNKRLTNAVAAMNDLNAMVLEAQKEEKIYLQIIDEYIK